MRVMLGCGPGGSEEVVRRGALENPGSVWAVLSVSPRWVTSLGVTVLSVFYAPSNSRIQRRLPAAAHLTPVLLSPPPGTCRPCLQTELLITCPRSAPASYFSCWQVHPSSCSGQSP